MATIRELTDAALHDLQGTGFSRRWLWELIRRLKLTVGSRVLVAGRRSRGLVRFLTNLGFDTDRFEEASGEKELDHGIKPHSLDAVVVGGLRRYEYPLNSPDVVRITASLLAAIRPGGRFVVVSGAEQSLDASRDHSAHCFAGLLNRFGSQVEACEGRNLFRWAASLWSADSAAPSDWQVCLTLPAIPVERDGWLIRAETSAADHSTSCCDAWMPEALRTVA